MTKPSYWVSTDLHNMRWVQCTSHNWCWIHANSACPCMPGVAIPMMMLLPLIYPESNITPYFMTITKEFMGYEKRMDTEVIYIFCIERGMLHTHSHPIAVRRDTTFFLCFCPNKDQKLNPKLVAKAPSHTDLLHTKHRHNPVKVDGGGDMPHTVHHM